MRIEGSGISCGVRRLVIDNNEKPTKDQLSTLIKNNSSCAIVMTNVPTRRRDVITLLLESGFEQVKNPARAEIKIAQDKSINTKFADLGVLIMNHGSQIIDDVDDAAMAEQFAGETVSSGLADMALLVMHHGNELIGNLSFFIRYMGK